MTDGEQALAGRSEGIKRRKEFKFVTALPADERIVGMIEHNRAVYFATDKGVYKIKNNKVRKIILVSAQEGMAVGCGDEDA